jgi:hypothetical protein
MGFLYWILTKIELTVRMLASKKNLFISGFQSVEEPAELQHD